MKPTSTPATTKKIPPHRKAIEDANKISSSSIKTKTPNSSTSSSSHNNNFTDAALDEDYEASKVTKSKKISFEAEIQMVKDLDNWG